MIETQRHHARTLVSTIHPTPTAGTLVEITGLISKGRPAKRYYTSVEPAVETALDLNALGYSVFVNVNPRCRMSAFEADVPYVTALALDLQPTRTSIADVFMRLGAAEIPPTITAWSGNGAHAYLLFDQPVDPNVAKLQGERLCKVTGSDPIWNSNRILRLPGSVNWKYPAWCYLTGVYPARRYSLEQIAAALDRLGAPPPRPPKAGIPVPLDPPEDWIELRKRLSEGVLDIIDTGEKNAYSEKQVTRSEADWVVVCALVRAGVPDEMIHWVYETQPVGIMKYRSTGAGYLNRTIESARRATAERTSTPAHARDLHRSSRGSSGDRSRRAYW